MTEQSGRVQHGTLRDVLDGASRWLLRAVGLALLLAVVVTPLDLRNQALFAVGIFVFALFMNRFEGRLVTMAMALVSMAVSTRYLYWRINTTLLAAEWSMDVVLGIVLLAAELYAFLMLLLGYFQSLGTLPRKPAPLPEDPRSWPSIDIYIPTYNEPLDVVRTTVLAAKGVDWPAKKLNVYILDDGRRDSFQSFAASAGVGYITRQDNQHAKAGNLNHALKKTRGEYIAIFDCDHVPTRSFLQTTVGWFLRDEELSVLQTPHHFYSPDPFERNLNTFRTVPNEGELFYGLIQPANDLWNAAFFCGSCAVLRRSALEDVGGIAVETVTEDAHTSLRMHRRGWSTAYLNLPQAAGLATESLAAHVGQRIRWARGMAQIFRIDNPLLGPGLKLSQRLCYLASMLYFLGGIPRLIFLLAPLSYLLFNRHIYSALPIVALAYGLPHLLHLMLTTSRIQGGVRHSFWSEVYDTCLSWYIALPTAAALINPRLGRFNVTAKGGQVAESYFEKKIARPYVVLLALNLIGAVCGLVKLSNGSPEVDVIVVNLVWSAQNILVLTATLAAAWEQRQRRESPRVAVTLPAMVRLQNGRTLRAHTVDLSRTGCALAMPERATLAPGQSVWISVFGIGEECPLPAEIVNDAGRTLRARFVSLSLEEESALTRIIFSRANAWTRWRQGRAADRPLSSLLGLTGLAAHGTRQIVRSLLPKPVPAAKPTATEGVP